MFNKFTVLEEMVEVQSQKKEILFTQYKLISSLLENCLQLEIEGNEEADNAAKSGTENLLCYECMCLPFLCEKENTRELPSSSGDLHH